MNQKPVVIFIHGWCMNSSCMEPFARAVQAAGFRTINTDLPLVDDAPFEACVDALRRAAGDAPCILVGYSMGGLIAQRFAERHPVAGLFLISCFPWPVFRSLSRHPGPLLHIARSVLRVLFARRTSAHFFLFIRTVIFGRLPPGSISILHDRFDYSATALRDDVDLFYEGMARTPMNVVFAYYRAMRSHHYGNIHTECPAMIICGERDPFVSKPAREWLARAMGAREKLYPSVTHLSIAQRTAEIAGDLTGWLRQNFDATE